MTPAARIAAAIEILDAWREGAAIERLLTNWARGSRFAGSKDRAAVRDLVFDTLRNLQTYAALGGQHPQDRAISANTGSEAEIGATTDTDTGANTGVDTGANTGAGDLADVDAGFEGRALMIGRLRAQGLDPAQMFTGAGYGPAALTPDEARLPEISDPESGPDLDNLPDWIAAEMTRSLGGGAKTMARALTTRAPLFLRVNLARNTRDEVIEALADEAIVARPHGLAETALEVVENPRRFAASQVFRDGRADVQDASSQAVSALVPAGGRVLDFCAGGGGKSLALADRGADVFAHDADPTRMRDIPERARRAGAKITVLRPAELDGAAPFDCVLVDAPCSGSGAWRRNPEGKWRLSRERLDALLSLQFDILTQAATRVGPRGTLAYATCSVFAAENAEQVAAFCAAFPAWSLRCEHRFDLSQGGDGFYVALLSRV